MKINLRKSKTSYTVMIISDSAKKHHREFHIKAGAVGAVTITVFALFVCMVCYIVYSSITLSDSMERSKEQTARIVQLKQENEQLAAENEQLEGKIAVLSDTVNQKVEAEQQLAAREEEEHLPKGFPLSGTAQMKTADEEADEAADTDNEEEMQEEGTGTGMQTHTDKREIIFTASAGINVIASGAGTVTEVGADVNYGNIVTIDHGNGYVSSYRNNSDAMVKAGSEVTRGSILFVIGEENTDTGYSISKDNTYIDPMEMIEING